MCDPRMLLAAVAAFLALALAPAAAFGLEVTSEADSSLCEDIVVSGTDVDDGCLLHTTSEGAVEVRKHVFGIESHITNCSHESHMRIATTSAGPAGYFLEQVLSGASCTRQACKAGGGEQSPWPFTQNEISEAEYLTSNLCVEPVGGGTDEMCEIDLPVNEISGGSHTYEAGQTGETPAHGITGFRCELVGHWNGEEGGTHDGASEVGIEMALAPLEPDAAIATMDFKHENPKQRSGGFTNTSRNSLYVTTTAEITGNPTRYTHNGGCNGVFLLPNQYCTIVVTANGGNEAIGGTLVVHYVSNGRNGDSQPINLVR